MTKTITIPISTETCDKIKHGVLLGLWILATVGLIYTVAAMWFDVLNIHSEEPRVFVGMFAGMGAVISLLFMLVHFRDIGFWVDIQCNCDAEDAEEVKEDD